MRGPWFLCRLVASRLNFRLKAIRVNTSAPIFVVRGWEQ